MTTADMTWAPSAQADDAAARLLRRWWPLIVIVVVTFAIRSLTFGDPNLDYDEQLYLVVGDRLLHGQLPYVDMWDRKPIGLFLFYAGIRLLGGEGIVQYQVVAAVCVALTASLIWSMARRFAGNVIALALAFAFILWLGPLHGPGGQAPVLYDPMMTGAASLAMRATRSDDRGVVVRLALGAMVLSGIAIQFKYTPFVEGAFFGCVFLYRLWRLELAIRHLAAVAAGMILIALLPTLAAIGFYWWSGHLDSFVQANIVSVFRRAPFPLATRVLQWLTVFGFGAPLFIALAVAVCRGRTMPDSDRDLFALVAGWLAAALVAVAVLGDFYDFYFITVMPPLLVFIAPCLSEGRAGFTSACLLVAWPTIFNQPIPGRAAKSRQAMTELVAAIKPYVGGTRCLYVYDGPTNLYLLTGACAPTRFLYPDHLTNPTEAPALGVDPVAEERRLLATKPGAIVTAARPLVPRVNPATQRLVKAALDADYVLTARIEAGRLFDVYVLKSLHPRPAPANIRPFDDPY